MEQWNHIVTAAMMGSEKHPFNAAILPEALMPAATAIQQNANLSREEQFLQLAALTMNYRQCGVRPVEAASVTLPVAAEETLPYCSTLAMRVLKDIIAEDMEPLLQIWLEQCTKHQQLIHPAHIPAMLELAAFKKKWQPMVTACCGKRGEWLAKFNPAWKFTANQTEEDAWQTGSPEQRKQVLKDQRAADPAKAIKMLQAVWASEDANTKQAFLSLLDEGISEADLPFLQSQLTEKSKKVKSETIRLMLLIPSSPLVKKNEELLRQLVHLQKEKTLLGMSSKLKIKFEPAINLSKEELTELGIDVTNIQPGETKEEHIYNHLIRAVPVEFWETHLGLPGEKIIELLQSDEFGSRLMLALSGAVGKYKNRRWAEMLWQVTEKVYPDTLSLLPADKWEEVLVKNFDKSSDSFTRLAMDGEHIWSTRLCKLILGEAARNPYNFQRNVFLKCIRIMPDEIVHLLDEQKPAEDYKATFWKNTSDYIRQLIQIRRDLIKAFNA
ncbi:hypothetical protein HHL16_05245 [Pseudoflavitalea sp. G-6-1-2]|uniref:DUF5691 domain-containing protein n=1 Tax=Pseudoflavitalea sp. G-6-1-2 TaxID=2728841 RepID=UPI00146D7B9A|nr:DUF5691 domain-containing protein [Pseudoflavitalea sp. G-6-1-2]NML20265.1 hypothetical protein [Pseudoflavitalea sp. G-6-1-2]